MIVTIVLLKVAWICAIPSGTFFRSRLRERNLYLLYVLVSTRWFPIDKRKSTSGRHVVYQPPLRAASFAFLPTEIVRALPFLVRALVFVRCPRTGNCRRWRNPR